MNRVFKLSVLFLLYYGVAGFAQSNPDIKPILTNKVLDSYPYHHLYKKHNQRQQLDSIFGLLEPQLKDPNLKILNRMAFCNAIDLIGFHADALNLLTDINKKIAQYPIVVQSDYYHVMGNIAMRSMNPTLATKHYQQSLELILSDKTISTEIVQSKYMVLGTGYNALENHQEAQRNFEKALLMETLGSNRNSLYLRLNMALTNSNLGELEIAKAYFKDALLLIKMNQDIFAEVRTLGNLADIYIKQDSLLLAERYYQEGLELAKKEGLNLDLIRFERSLSKLFQQKKEYQNAYQHLLNSDSINNVYNSLSISEQLAKMEMQHKVQTEKIQKELSQQLLTAAQKQNYLLAFFMVIIIMACFVLVWQLVQLKEKNKILLQQNLQSIQQSLPKEISTSTQPTIDYQPLLDLLQIEIETTKIYTDSTLTLESLSKKLQTNRTYLSEAINSNFQMSFSRWLSELRVKESKKMLASSDFDHYSIEGISTMVGFASISAFNSNFKKITGITPSYFRNNRSIRG